MAIVESFASGTPVVVLRDSGGPAELVTEDVGRCSDDGPAALSVACTEALALSQEPQTRDACRAVAEQYDWDARIVPRMLEVYRGG
jgi:glycosyltransferase involved in cell wall biosynthesis